LNEPLLIFAYGNPSRGDDALGPLLIEHLQILNLEGIEMLTDFQLQVEHAYDLQGRERVLFIDASVSCESPYTFSRLFAQKDPSYTTHVMSPMAVMHVYQELYGDPPPSYLLQVRGESFELGESLSPQAEVNLQSSLDLLRRLCSESNLQEWDQLSLPH
jgi:hydrogenase maturation protease